MIPESFEAVRDPLWKHIYIPSKLYDAVKTEDFVRLTRIRQLGPTYLVYPGATHTRASHSFGVYHIAMRLLERLLEQGASEWTSESGRKAFAAAALFHDLGHFPYTHSLKELPLVEHEELTARILCKNPLKDIIEAWGTNPEQVAAIVDSNIKVISNIEETLFFRKLLSGVLDPDKLDYLNRDAFFCGVPYGIQDIDYILSIMYPDKKNGISVDSAGISSVENILFSKYLMYRAVYWHKQVRMATAMMKKTLAAALRKEIVSPDELYNLDDESIHYLLYDRYNSLGHSKFEEYVCAQELRDQCLYSTVIEIPFDSTNERHLLLEKLENRTNIEQEISMLLQCSPSHILLDIPERISFESDLRIRDLSTNFSNSPTVFSQNTVTSFVSTLRKIRIGLHSKKVRVNNKQKEKIIALYL